LAARLEEENGGVGAVNEATRDHATRRPRADDHVVITASGRLAAPGLMVMVSTMPHIQVIDCHVRRMPLS
jgi:hypothetical protein